MGRLTSAATLSIEESLSSPSVYVHGEDRTTITSTWMTQHAVKNKDVTDPQVSRVREGEATAPDDEH